MKILIVTQNFFPENTLNNLSAKYLSEMGHKIQVICCVPNYGQPNFFENYSNKKNTFEIWNGIEINRVFTIARKNKKLRIALNYLFFVLSGIYFVLFRLKDKPDVIFTPMPSPVFQGFIGIVMKIRFKIPVIFWVQDIWPESAFLGLNLSNKHIAKVLFFISKVIYQNADKILVQSKSFVPLIKRFKIDSDRIIFLPNTAINLIVDKNYVEKFKQINNIQHGNFNIFFTGNLGESQALLDIIKVAKKTKTSSNIKWYFVGHGLMLEKLKNAVAQQGLTEIVKFIKPVSQEKIGSVLSLADALLVSLKDEFVFRCTIPSKLQTYMASGKPILGYVAGEANELIQHANCGLTAKPGQIGKFASCVLKLYSSSARKRDLYGQNGKLYFEKNFSQKIVFGNLECELNLAPSNSLK